MARLSFSNGWLRRRDLPRRALRTPTTPKRTVDPSAGRARWVSRACVAATVGVLGLALAGAMAISGQAAANSGALPWDTSRAVPAPAVANAGSLAGRDGRTDPTQDSGALDAFDRREPSTSRDAKREALERAQVSQRAQQRQRQLAASREAAQRNNRDLSAAERNKELEQTREKIAAERKAAEKRQQELEKKRRAAEAARRVSTPLPAGSYRVGAGWGAWGSWARYHTGQDFAAPYGTPIFAAKAGVVVPGAGGWAGVDVAIRHSDGGATLYAHMSHRAVSVGETVSAGQVIGYVGSTGRSFGPHLHFEYYPPGTKVGDVYSTRDPIAWLRSNGGHI